MEVALQHVGGFPSEQLFGGHHHVSPDLHRSSLLDRRRPSLKISTFFPSQSRNAPRMDAPPRDASALAPLEIWQHIFNDQVLKDDLPSLWRKCRQVCRTFRVIVDDIFRKEVLADMMIEFDLDWDYLDRKNLTEKCFFGLEMAFDRFSDENREVAVFKNSIQAHEREPGFKERHDKMERAKWREKMSVYTPPNIVGPAAMDTRFDLPPWTIEIRKKVNDTELPGWKVNYAAKEISFRWKDAMEAFYREAEYIAQDKIARIKRGGYAGRFVKLRGDVVAGRISHAKAWLEMIRIEEDAFFAGRKDIRRHRVRKFYSTNYKLDPEKHKYGLEDVIDILDEEAENEALMKMREMEWIRSGSILSLLANSDGDPLNNPETEHFLQSLMDGEHSDNEYLDDSEEDFYDETDVE